MRLPTLCTSVLFIACVLIIFASVGAAQQVDTDGDGLLDLIDLEGVPLVFDLVHDQGQIHGTHGLVSLGTDTWSQSITAGIHGQLAGIEFQIDDYDRFPPETIDFEFSVFDGGNPPTGPALFSQRITIDQIDGGMEYMWDVSSADVVLDDGDVFTFALSAVQDNVDVSADYRFDGSGYPRGELYRNGNSLPLGTSDMALKTYILGASSIADYRGRGIQDLDGDILSTNLQDLDLRDNQITSIESEDFGGLTNLQRLALSGNQIASIERGAFSGLTKLEGLYLGGNQISSIASSDFAGLANLRELSLSGNQITSIESNAFAGLNSLRSLDLSHNRIFELNLSGAVFESLSTCAAFSFAGFCATATAVEIAILDDATLSILSFDAITSQTRYITEASLVGLRFFDEQPGNLANLLGIETLNNVTVDQALFEQYADELNAFAELDGNTLTVIGYGDANKDGEFNSGDLVSVFGAGEYEDGIAENSYWTEGDWNSDGDFDSADLVRAFEAGTYEQGPVNAVPEPSGLALLLMASLVLIKVSKQSFLG